MTVQKPKPSRNDIQPEEAASVHEGHPSWTSISPVYMVVAVYLAAEQMRRFGEVGWWLALTPLSPLLLPAAAILHFAGVRIQVDA